MSTNALLDQDFGSESEDDNFNPAPADESDNENAVEPSAEDDESIKDTRRLDSNGLKKEDFEDNKHPEMGGASTRPFSEPGLPEEDEAEGLHRDGGEDEEEDEDLEEEDDDEEEVVSVVTLPICLMGFLLIFQPGSSPEEGAKGSSKPVSRC